MAPREIAFNHHPVDDIEPEIEYAEAFREASLRFAYVLEIAYHFVVTSDRPRMAMQQIAVALGLPAARQMSEQEFALLNQVTRQDFSKGVTKFLRISGLPPAFGLKSDETKLNLRDCQRTGSFEA
jgi:hypothetical protein